MVKPNKFQTIMVFIAFKVLCSGYFDKKKQLLMVSHKETLLVVVKPEKKTNYSCFYDT